MEPNKESVEHFFSLANEWGRLLQCEGEGLRFNSSSSGGGISRRTLITWTLRTLTRGSFF